MPSPNTSWFGGVEATDLFFVFFRGSFILGHTETGLNYWALFPYTFLVGGWTNPSEKYDRQNGFIFPNFRGENSKNIWNHHLDIGWIAPPSQDAKPRHHQNDMNFSFLGSGIPALNLHLPLREGATPTTLHKLTASLLLKNDGFIGLKLGRFSGACLC